MAASHAPDGRRRRAGPWGKKLRKLQAWISRRLGATSAEDDDERGEARDLAVAALLVEVLRADFQVEGQERRQVLAAIRETLRLDPARCEELLAEAEQQVDQAHDLHQFTATINRALSHAEKLRLVEQLWRVAQADATVHKYEEHIIRRIADLLHVSHREFIAAKLRAAGE